MSTPSAGPGDRPSGPGDEPLPVEPTRPVQPAPSTYGTPSSPYYGKYGQGTAVPTAPPAAASSPAQVLIPAARFRGSGSLGTAVIVMSVLYTATDWLAAILMPAGSPSITDTLQGKADPDPAFSNSEIAAVAAFPVLIGVWIVTATWLARARDNAVLLNPQGQRRSRGWIWFGWVVPIVYLWFPKQILDDTTAATGPAAGDRLPVRTNAYWGLWVTSILLGAVGSAASAASAAVTTQRSIAIAESIVLTAALVLWIRVVRRISAAQDTLALSGPVEVRTPIGDPPPSP